MIYIWTLFMVALSSPGFAMNNFKDSFWSTAKAASPGDSIILEIQGDSILLCPERKELTKPNLTLGDLFIDGKLDKTRLNEFIEESLWIEGKLCATNDQFFLISSPSKTKGSIFFDGVEKILEKGVLSDAPDTSNVALEDPEAVLTDDEKEILQLIKNPDDRRFLNDRSLQPGEVDIFVLVDINPDVVEKIGSQEDTVTYALNLFSWINSHVYHPIGFNVQVSEINIRTTPCPRNCMKHIRENEGQPSKAHLVHHMTLEGSLGYGSVGGLYTRSKWGGVSTCPKIKGNFGMWERICVSHELGHNFGGVHTHDQSPQIDTCGDTCSSGGQMNVAFGTIMSYCHKCSGGYNNIHFQFHEQTRDTLWRLYDLKKNTKLNEVATGTVGIDLATLAPWSTTTTQPRGPRPTFGTQSTASSTTTQGGTSSIGSTVSSTTTSSVQQSTRSTTTLDNTTPTTTHHIRQEEDAGAELTSFLFAFVMFFFYL